MYNFFQDGKEKFQKLSSPTYQTKNYLRDVFLAQHVLLKLLDGSKEIVVRSRKKLKKKSKKKKVASGRKEKVAPLQDEGLREGAWNDVEDEISASIKNSHSMDETMNLNLLDPTAEPAIALGVIQLALHGRTRARNLTSAELSVRLLRAAQKLWPENEEFGRKVNKF